MSLVPLLFSDWWQDLERPHRLLDQDFGHGLSHDQLIPPHFLESYAHPAAHPASHAAVYPSHAVHPLRRRHPLNYYRPWGELMRQMEGGGTSTVKADKDKFQVVLDVQQFKPEEITVKVVDKYVIVEGKHEEKQDEHGSISRHFVRKYLIPEQCNLDEVSSNLSTDGVLSITAPRKDQPKAGGEKIVKIEHTGKPAIKESAEKKSDKKDDKK